MERSMRCFLFSLLGLIPILGLGMAIQAFVTYGRVRREVGEEWNPAARYLKWGRLLASIGLLISSCVIFAILTAIVSL